MLHLYKPLTSSDPTVRLRAASELTSQLLALVGSDSTAPAVEFTLDEAKADTAPPSASTPASTSPVISKAPKRPKDELHYALTRLIRGLASGHESARFGFAVVLTEYLSTLLLPQNQLKWAVSVELVLGLVHKHMEITEHLSRLEERDRWLGRLFGLKAIIMSGCLFQAGEGGVSQEREFRTVISEILDLGREKSWLREPGMWTVVAATRKFGWKESYVGIVWMMVVERNLAKTSEGVGVWLCFEELCPGTMGEVEEGKVWGEGRGGPLMGGNLPVVARVLKESGVGEGEKDLGSGGAGEQGKGKKGGKGSGVGGKGVWNPKLHWVWDEIIRVYLAQDSATPETAEEKKKGGKEKKFSNVTDSIAPFSQFWLIVVDESFFSASSSEERKFHGFLLLIKLFKLLTSAPQYIPTLLPHLFTRNLLRCIINHLSDPSRYLHKSAEKTISTIQQLATAQPSSIPYIVKGLVLGNGTTRFDQLTKAKTVEKLLPLAGESEDALREVVEMFRDIIVTPLLTKPGKAADGEDDPNTDESAGGDDDQKENIKAAKREEESKRQWAADQILSLVRSGRGKKHDAWAVLVVELFAVLGHFDVTQLTGGTKSIASLVLGGTVPVPKVSEASRSMFRARLSSVLGHLLSLKMEEVGDAVGAGLDRDTWPYRTVRIVREVMAAGGVLAMEFDEQLEEAVESGWGKLESIRAKRARIVSKMAANEKEEKQRASETSQLQAFELLYSLVLLQTYNGDSDAVELLEELEVCYGRIVKETPKASEGGRKKAPAKETPTGEEDNVDASAILVDLILSFLAKPSVLLRKIAGTVWSRFVGTSVVGKPALDALMEILETKESFIGQQALFDKEGEGVGEDDDDDDLEMDSDVEQIIPEDDGDEAGDTMEVDEEYKDVKQPVSIDDDPKVEEEDDESDDDMATPTSGSDEETDLPTDDETTRFEEALGKALKTKKVLPGQKDELESDSDADMTDSEMMGLDEHLSIIFRERLKKLRAPLSKKKERVDARENVIVFKGKVIELLEGYVRGRFGGGREALGDGGLFLTCIVPRFLAVMRITGKLQLREKIAGVLRLFVREAGKDNNAGGTEAVDIEELWKTLMGIHEEVLKGGGGVGHTAACSMGSIAVVKALLKAQQGIEVVERITGVYAGTMAKWLLSGGVGGGAQAGNTLQIQSFFTDFVGWGGSVRKAAVVGKKEKEKGEGSEKTRVEGDEAEKSNQKREDKRGKEDIAVLGKKDKQKEDRKKEEKKRKEKARALQKQKEGKNDNGKKAEAVKQEKKQKIDKEKQQKAEVAKSEKKDRRRKIEGVKPKKGKKGREKMEKDMEKEKKGKEREKKKEKNEKKEGKRGLIVAAGAAEQSKKAKTKG